MRSDLHRRSFLLGTMGALIALSNGNADAAMLQPPIWRCEGAGATIWLLGGVHSLRETDTWLPRTFVEVIQAADRVFVESDQRAGVFAEIERSSIMLGPPFTRLSQRLPEPAAERFSDLLQVLGNTEIDRYKAIFALEFLKSAYLQKRHGYSFGFGMDVALRHYARPGRLKGLEAPLAATRAFAAADENKALGWLANLAQSPDRWAERYDAFISHWQAGDLRSLEAFSREALGEGDPKLWEAVVDRRQREWVRKITAEARRGRVIVVGVGVAHVVGARGLPVLLSQAGFHADPIGG